MYLTSIIIIEIYKKSNRLIDFLFEESRWSLHAHMLFKLIAYKTKINIYNVTKQQ